MLSILLPPPHLCFQSARYLVSGRATPEETIKILNEEYMAGRRKRWISPDEWREKLGANYTRRYCYAVARKLLIELSGETPILDIPDEPYEIIMEIHEEPAH